MNTESKTPDWFDPNNYPYSTDHRYWKSMISSRLALKHSIKWDDRDGLRRRFRELILATKIKALRPLSVDTDFELELEESLSNPPALIMRVSDLHRLTGWAANSEDYQEDQLRYREYLNSLKLKSKPKKKITTGSREEITGAEAYEDR